MLLLLYVNTKTQQQLDKEVCVIISVVLIVEHHYFLKAIPNQTFETGLSLY